MVSEHSDDENTSTEAKDTNTANRKAGKTANAGRAVSASEKTEKTGKPARKDAPALGFVGMLRWCWTQLTKMNTALMLLLLLAIAAVPGSIFPQRVQDPTKVTDYIKNHPGWGEFADKIQLFDVFSSAWFSAIYLLLFISLIGCVTPRAIKHAKDWRKPPARTPRNLSRMPVHRQLEIPVADAGLNLSAKGAIEDAARILKKSHYRVEIRDEENDHYSVGAERGYLREIGNILFHVAMIGILVGVAFGSLYGYRGQKILVQDETFVNSLIGYDSFTPGTNYNPDWLTPYAVTLNNFQVRYDRQQDSHTYGQDLDYKAELTVHDPQGGTEQKTLKVNEPVDIGGTSIFLSGNGYAPVVRVTDGEGKVAYEGTVVGITMDGKYTSSVVLKVPDAKPSQLGFVGMFLPTGDYARGTTVPHSVDSAPANPMLIFQSYSGDLGLNSGQPQNVYVLDTSKLQELNSMAQGNGIVLSAQNPEAVLPDNKGKIEFLGYKRYVGLDVRHDPGQNIVLYSFVVAFAGLIVSLFVARRRVWVRAHTADGVLVVEYGLLARGEDPRLANEAERLTDAFAAAWGLEFDDDNHDENEGK